jgi:hypothetical protein
MSSPTCYNNFVTVTFGGALCFYPKSRLSVRASRDCDKHVETTGRRLFDSENTMYLYLLQSGHSEYFKIGHSDNIEVRIANLQAGNPHGIRLVCSANMDRDAAISMEHTLHAVFAKLRSNREWFRLGAEESDFIKELCRVLQSGDENSILAMKPRFIEMSKRHAVWRSGGRK